MNKALEAEESDEYEQFLTEIIASERKQQFLYNFESLSEYLMFKVSTTYITGDQGKSPEELGIAKETFLPLSDLIMDDSDPWQVFPKLNIADHIWILGDYFDSDYSKIKSSTKFEIKADFYKIQMDAWTRAAEHFDAALDDGSLAESDECPEAEESDAPLTFHEKIKDQVLSQFIDMQGTIDSKFRKKYVQLENFIDSMIEEEQDNTIELEAHQDFEEVVEQI